MSSKRAMKQAQKQAFAKHRSNITKSRFNSNKRNDLSSIIQKASLQTRGVISFGIPIDIKSPFIQAPSLALILDNPALKKPLWEKIQKTFIK